MADNITLFQETHPSLESYWRSAILFGRNVASYKFALAKSLFEIAPTGRTEIAPTGLTGTDRTGNRADRADFLSFKQVLGLLAEQSFGDHPRIACRALFATPLRAPRAFAQTGDRPGQSISRHLPSL